MDAAASSRRPFRSGYIKQTTTPDNNSVCLTLNQPTPSDSNNDVRQVILAHINSQHYVDALMLCVSASDNNNDLGAASLIFSLIKKATKHSDDLPALYAICTGQPHSTASRYALGVIYNAGYGEKWAKEDKHKLTVDYFTPLANEEYAPAQFHLGCMYYHGHGVQQNDTEAVRLYKLAADQGYPPAQSNLGLMYYRHGIQKDHAEAVRLFQLAADQGVAEAQSNLGWMYIMGHGVQKDYAEAVRLFQLAADQGLANVQYELGRRYKNGKGVSQNDTKAAWYYQQAANQGLTSAQDNLKALYLEGRGKVSPATEQVYFTAMEELGVPENVYLFHLGIRYLNNNGVDRQSHTQARKHLEKAKELGHPSAAFYLGESYREGGNWFGMQQDHVKAKENYTKAAQSGDKQIEAKAALNSFYPEVNTSGFAPAPPDKLNPINKYSDTLYNEF